MSLRSAVVAHPGGHRAFVEPPLFPLNDLTVGALLAEEDKLLAYRLRSRIFFEELGWAVQSRDGLEIDDYDQHAVFFGVKSRQGRLLAFIRLILPEHDFMVEREFLPLVGPHHTVRKERDTVELSRLCVAPESRTSKIAGNFGMGSISMLLIGEVYRWCLQRRKRYVYAVTEYKVYKLLCFRGIPCKPVGATVLMAGGVQAVAFRIDLQEMGCVKSDRGRFWAGCAFSR